MKEGINDRTVIFTTTTGTFLIIKVKEEASSTRQTGPDR